MPKYLTKLAAAALCAIPLLSAAQPASTSSGQAYYPTCPVRLIIPSGAGGVIDILARHIAPNWAMPWGSRW